MLYGAYRTWIQYTVLWLWKQCREDVWPPRAGRSLAGLRSERDRGHPLYVCERWLSSVDLESFFRLRGNSGSDRLSSVTSAVSVFLSEKREEKQGIHILNGSKSGCPKKLSQKIVITILMRLYRHPVHARSSFDRDDPPYKINPVKSPASSNFRWGKP